MNWKCALLVLIGCWAQVGCANRSATKDILTPDYLLARGSKQLTFLGDNDHPRFSPDGKTLLFTSRHRSFHRSAQVYELDLEKNKERRVTFSDGDAFDAIYLGNDEVLYASTTDEVKESPLLNKSFDLNYPPSDLYMSDRFGNEILRLTQQPGLDAEPLFWPHITKPAIIFTSRRGELTGLYKLDLKNLPTSLVSAQKDKEKRDPTLTPDFSQIAWVEKDLKSEEESLVLFNLKSKIPRVLKAGEGQYKDLFFAPQNPERLFYSILRKGDKKQQIEVYNLATHCTQVVFKGQDSLSSPAISHQSPEMIAFSRVFKERKQIYLAPLPQDLGPCLAPPAQANLK